MIFVIDGCDCNDVTGLTVEKTPISGKISELGCESRYLGTVTEAWKQFENMYILHWNTSTYIIHYTLSFYTKLVSRV